MEAWCFVIAKRVRSVIYISLLDSFPHQKLKASSNFLGKFPRARPKFVHKFPQSRPEFP